MTSGSYRFDRFCLDLRERRLTCDGAAVELNGRYMDALALLVGEQGSLVSKERFLDEVWRGVPVTDEALTQCIRTLRRQLGDDATRPRFIETVPKHGYRFIAPVDGEAARVAQSSRPSSNGLVLGVNGTLGGAAAGVIGGLIYGFAGALAAPDAGVGATSVLAVMVCVTTLVGSVGGAGVSFGMAAARRAGRGAMWSIAGAAFGGVIVGAVVKLLGLDALRLLFGHAPSDITGPFEGLVLGAAVGAGYLLGTGGGRVSLSRGAGTGAAAGALAGATIPLLGGQMMIGSLQMLARTFPDSRFTLEPVGTLFGEPSLGPVSRLATGALEGALFAGCVVAAMILAVKRRSSPA